MELRQLRQEFRDGLSPMYPATEIDAIFYLILDFYLELPRHILGIEPGKLISDVDTAKLKSALSQLKKGTPVQYVTGKALFRGLNFSVGPGVLIPRPETEELVDWILENCLEASIELKILDVGSGSGCIPVALARELPKAQIHGLEKSEDALGYAKQNAAENGVSVIWHHLDMLNPGKLPCSFEIIVSNPPYIPNSEYHAMHPNVRDFEPEMALFVPDNDPLKFYKAIVSLSDVSLLKGGWLYLEIHENLYREVEVLLKKSRYQEVQVKSDIFGKPRFVRGRR
jgi:release factor glutamine methyltransferase